MLTRDLGFEIAQGDRQDSAKLAFENAELTRKLGQRRILVDPDRHGKARGILQKSARVILQISRQFEGQLRLFREGPPELEPMLQRLCGRVDGFGGIDPARFILEPDGLQGLTGHLGREDQFQRQHGQTA